ncbi:MAG: hypothetical protein V1788_02000 [Nanoarchaeota archaeon]|nr:hypothetical protein [Nanoarchaeota archaeon]
MERRGKKKIKIHCFVDKKFKEEFSDWKKFIREILDYSGKHLKVPINIEISKWNNEELPRKFNSYLGDLNKKMVKSDINIGFTGKEFFIDAPFNCGMALDKSVIVAKFFPVKIPLLYRYGLKKLTLHELGHMFYLKDSFGWKFSIMDNFWGIITSRFTKKERGIIKKVYKSKYS